MTILYFPTPDRAGHDRVPGAEWSVAVEDAAGARRHLRPAGDDACCTIVLAVRSLTPVEAGTRSSHGRVWSGEATRLDATAATSATWEVAADAEVGEGPGVRAGGRVRLARGPALTTVRHLLPLGGPDGARGAPRTVQLWQAHLDELAAQEVRTGSGAAVAVEACEVLAVDVVVEHGCDGGPATIDVDAGVTATLLASGPTDADALVDAGQLGAWVAGDLTTASTHLLHDAHSEVRSRPTRDRHGVAVELRPAGRPVRASWSGSGRARTTDELHLELGAAVAMRVLLDPTDDTPERLPVVAWARAEATHDLTIAIRSDAGADGRGGCALDTTVRLRTGGRYPSRVDVDGTSHPLRPAPTGWIVVAAADAARRHAAE